MDCALYDRIKTLCDERGISPTRLEKDLGFGVSSITKGKGSPSADRVAAIASYFHVSVDYLVGNSSIRSVAEDILKDQTIISIQRAMQRMPEKDRERALKILEAGFTEAFSGD